MSEEVQGDRMKECARVVEVKGGGRERRNAAWMCVAEAEVHAAGGGEEDGGRGPVC